MFLFSFRIIFDLFNKWEIFLNNLDMHFDFLLMKFYHIKTHLEKISMILFRNWYHEEKKEIGIEYIINKSKKSKKRKN